MEFRAVVVFEEASKPRNWLYMASVLHKAARKIDWRPMPEDVTDWRWIPVYRMLIGFAIENLMKGILIAEDKVPAFKDGRLASDFATHGLRKHAARIKGIKFTDAEMRLLAELEPYVIWAGRYPAPKDPAGLIEVGHSLQTHDLEEALGNKLAAFLERLAPEPDLWAHVDDMDEPPPEQEELG